MNREICCKQEVIDICNAIMRECKKDILSSNKEML